MNALLRWEEGGSAAGGEGGEGSEEGESGPNAGGGGGGLAAEDAELFEPGERFSERHGGVGGAAHCDRGGVGLSEWVLLFAVLPPSQTLAAITGISFGQVWTP